MNDIVTDTPADIAAFANRLHKNARHWGKWARRRGISCYRVYDRDIPEFPLALDIYQDRAHLQEYFRANAGDGEEGENASGVDAEAQRSGRLEMLRQVVAQALEMPLTAVHLKRRERQRGAAQYEKTGAAGEDFVANENNHRFILNLDAYLDTGLFLDHRNTRRRVQERAAGKRFLNLFCYTGSFTVYAAAGGASSSDSVDLSNTYLDWARRNFELNGLNLKKHQLVRTDVSAFLEQALAQGKEYDLIVLDPPSFSNSKKMTGVLDVQRDHAVLINRCMKLLSGMGELIFSTNLKSFRLDSSIAARWRVEDISAATVPEDFRNKKIHRCWRIVQAGATGVA